MSNMCDSGAVKLKAGTNVSSSISLAQYDQLILQAEAYINCVAREFLGAGYAGYVSGAAKILEDTASSIAANFAINFDQSDYTTDEVSNLINLNWATAERNLALLKERDKATAFLLGE